MQRSWPIHPRDHQLAVTSCTWFQWTWNNVVLCCFVLPLKVCRINSSFWTFCFYFLEWNKTLNCASIIYNRHDWNDCLRFAVFIAVGKLADVSFDFMSIFFDISLVRKFEEAIFLLALRFFDSIFHLPCRIVVEISFNCRANAAKYRSKVRRYFKENKALNSSKFALITFAQYCMLTVSFILHHCAFIRLTLHHNSVLNRSPGLRWLDPVFH